MADDKATLILKLGDNEIRYEAAREAVEAQLENVLGRLLQEAPNAGAAIAGEPPQTAEPPPASPAASPEAAEAQRLKQLYVIAKGGRLRLRKLPGRTAEALLLVLYGMRKLQGRNWVHAPGMTSAARASGARFDRADRLLAGFSDLVEGFGKRRAKRYRLTAAGREYCAKLVRDLAGPVAPPPAAATAATKPDAEAEDPSGIPKKVRARWDGELLNVAEAAEQLGVTEAEVRKLRFHWQLLGLPGGTRERRDYFFPTFQIDAERRRIYPQARETTKLISRRHTSWGIAEWWSTVEPELDRKPMELIGTPEADEVVRVARATFVRKTP